jgi:hypothetical protein
MQSLSFWGLLLTLGWMSADLPEPKGHHGRRHNGEDHGSSSASKNITFSRRYLDPNRVTFEVGFIHP